MNQSSEQAWGDFWAQQEASEGGGCLPDGFSGIEAVQKATWTAFASSLAESAPVLDLATGDGRVMRWLREANPALKCTGVDLAPKLPPAPEGTQTRGGIAMEDLPFEDGAFDIVVSQFGFEYGDATKAAAEAKRVLTVGGQLAIMTHRIDGPILAHNQARRMQIGWIFDRKDLFSVAHASLPHRTPTSPAIPIQVNQAVQEGRQRFGPNSAAWEIAEAIRRTLLMGPQVAREQVAATLRTLEERAKNEIGRINSLEAACKTTADIDAFEGAILKAGFAAVSVEPLSDKADASPFADFRIYKHAG